MKEEKTWSWKLAELTLVGSVLCVVLVIELFVFGFAIYTWASGVDNHMSNLPLWSQIVNAVALLCLTGVTIRELLTLPKRIFRKEETYDV